MYVILIAIFFFVSAALAGLFASPLAKNDNPAPTPTTYQCCNTGEGKNCKPDRSKPLGQYGGDSYALLKSDVYLQTLNSAEHYDPGRKNTGGALAGQKVFVNVVPEKKNTTKTHKPECTKVPDPGFDWIYGKKVDNDHSTRDFGCYRVPDDMLIYVCRDDNAAGDCDDRELSAKKVRFDVWIKLKDVPNDDINTKYPFLTNCYKPENEEERGEAKIVFRPSPDGQDNLQLRTFKFIEPQKPATWLSPYCKPAIYLYPERKTEINVSVAPQGNMLLTIPPYPKNGWDVMADSDGSIYSGKERFDYLYYEAAIPDQLIHKPSEGFIIPYDEREKKMREIITTLGLNEKETQQFLDYWVPILPKSPYYFIGIIPPATLHEISPLIITPKPTSLIRLTLYFQALQMKETIREPMLVPYNRQGFTAVEWGGIVKRDQKHPFSCFM